MWRMWLSFGSWTKSKTSQKNISQIYIQFFPVDRKGLTVLNPILPSKWWQNVWVSQGWMSQRLKAVSLCDLGEGKISNSSDYVAKSSCWNRLSNLMSMLLALGFVSAFNRRKLCGMRIMSLEGWPSAWLCYTWPQLRTGFHGGGAATEGQCALLAQV